MSVNQSNGTPDPLPLHTLQILAPDGYVCISPSPRLRQRVQTQRGYFLRDVDVPALRFRFVHFVVQLWL